MKGGRVGVVKEIARGRVPHKKTIKIFEDVGDSFSRCCDSSSFVCSSFSCACGDVAMRGHRRRGWSGAHRKLIEFSQVCVMDLVLD